MIILNELIIYLKIKLMYYLIYRLFFDLIRRYYEKIKVKAF